MVVFDQLRIDNSGSKLYIDFHVNFAPEYDNIMLDSIVVTTADKILEGNSNSIPEQFIYKKTYNQDLQADNIVIDRGVLDAAFTNINSSGRAIDSSKPIANVSFTKGNFSSDLVFVYVTCKGTLGGEVPCGMDEKITLAVTLDESAFYQIIMGYTKEFNKSCELPKGLINTILLWYGLKSAINTEHYAAAIDFWKRLFENKSSYIATYRTNSCGCHG